MYCRNSLLETEPAPRQRESDDMVKRELALSSGGWAGHMNERVAPRTAKKVQEFVQMRQPVLHSDELIDKKDVRHVEMLLEELLRHQLPVQVVFLQGAVPLQLPRLFARLCELLLTLPIWSINLGELRFSADQCEELEKTLKRSLVTHMFYECARPPPAVSPVSAPSSRDLPRRPLPVPTLPAPAPRAMRPSRPCPAPAHPQVHRRRLLQGVIPLHYPPEPGQAPAVAALGLLRAKCGDPVGSQELVLPHLARLQQAVGSAQPGGLARRRACAVRGLPPVAAAADWNRLVAARVLLSVQRVGQAVCLLRGGRGGVVARVAPQRRPSSLPGRCRAVVRGYCTQSAE